jgi:hypothetical protein
VGIIARELIMRRFIVVAVSTLMFATATVSAKAEESATVSHFQVLAIGAGAIVGVIAANIISGGMITPILTGAAIGMPADAAAAATVVETASAATVAAQAGIIIVGGAVGAAVGNWLSNGN